MSKILCILDGFGLSATNKNNCNARAKMPNLRKMMTKYGVGSLDADGEAVGQEAGLVGNSEVGHMNIGGLKLCPQLSFQITKSSESNFAINKELAPDQNFDPSGSLKNKKIVHLAGLFSTGCIHSDLRHWAGAIRCSVDAGVEKVILHLFSDGRDSDKKSLVQTWKDFAKQFEGTDFADKIYLGSLGGRFFAMDRDKNYDRVEKGTSAIFNPYNFYTPNFSGKSTESMLEYANYLKTNFEIEKDFTPTQVPSFDFLKTTDNLNEITKVLKQITTKSYENGIFDEMLVPMTFMYEENFEVFGVKKNETLWFVNFRSDRMKQLGKFVVGLNTKYSLNLNILGMSDYGIGGGYEPIFTSKPVQNTLAQTISKINKIDKIVLMHCRGGENSKYFYEGIKSWCKNKNIEYIAPKIVGNDAPAKDWLDELSKIEITKNTVLIGHSMGCIALCKYLSDNNLAFNSLHLVAGWQYNVNSPSQNALAQGNTFEPETIDYQKIKNNGNVVLHCSLDDAPNRLENTQKYENYFEIKANWYQNYAHFNQDNVSFVELEESLETTNQTTQLHLAETEKYAHVTFFFNGGMETKSSGEDWMVIPSNKVNSHAEIPEMKAKEITDYILENNAKYDYIMVNYANPDMVGHTGDIPASIRSMEFLDTQLGRLFEAVEKDGHSMVIIADHGNVEFVGEYIKGDKELTDTEHNANPVPCIVIGGKNPAQIIKRDFSQEWLTAEEVETLRKTALPLWKAGEILINL